MANFNKVILVGNLTATPTIRTTPGKGTSVTDLSLAINRSYNNASGVRQEDTTFVDVTLWGAQADTACRYMTKGSPVLIEGRLQQDVWQDRETGKNRSRLRVIGENFQMLGSRPQNNEGGIPQNGGGYQQPSYNNGYANNAGSPPQRPQSSRPSNQPPVPPMMDDDEDVPF